MCKKQALQHNIGRVSKSVKNKWFGNAILAQSFSMYAVRQKAYVCYKPYSSQVLLHRTENNSADQTDLCDEI